jgi:beta-N-acetylhexosaminidase
MRINFFRWVIFIMFLISLSAGSVQANPPAQSSSAQASAQALLDTLTPEEKIGQLFLITFKGIDASGSSQIYDLIVKHHIGGVVLQASNDNFTAQGTVPNAFGLIGALQQDEYAASQSEQTDPVSGNSFSPAFIPLFAGIAQAGDGWPYDQILSGLTNLPNEMTIGATWNTSYANQVGSVMGKELEAMGFNLLLGPSLDVLEINQLTGFNDLGTRTFGGDPFWVGEMGKAYINGLHLGSNSRLAVVATHFPGSGGADRSPEEEVPTVQKSLEQLKQIELAPFFAVTGNAPDPESTTDGLLVSHIRYQGFQGNIRDTTKPVSFDSTALSLLMGLDPFASWRRNEGVLVSDDLGSRAVRRFYDPTEKTFNARQVALNAFLAGNDLLYADNFVANGDPDSYTTILSTLTYFVQKYREDSAFKQRVDDSVLRNLTLKFRLYPSFRISNVLPPQSGLNSVNLSSPLSFEIARKAVSLISPNSVDLASLLPKPPQLNDHIIFFTDVLTARQCSKCPDRQSFAVDGLQNAILKLYGPQVTGQVSSDNLVSYSFFDLQNYLGGKADAPKTLANDLNISDWVVFSMLTADPSRPETLALRNVLEQRPDLLRNKKIIVFAFDAPYFLDATDISKLTAFYGLYSKGPNFLDAAAGVLFQELPLQGGALPVSVPGVGYEVLEVTKPDPNQVIPLYQVIPGIPPPTSQVTTTPYPTAETSKIGDTINLQTGVIFDHNHNPVPDGTSVVFTFTIGGDKGSTQQTETSTVQGIAKFSYRIDKSGQILIGVSSDQANQSMTITLNVPSGVTPGVVVTVNVPTPLPSFTATYTLVPTFTVTPTVFVSPLRSGKPDVGEWTLIMLVIIAAAGMAFAFSYRLLSSLRWGVRWGLCTVLGGLVVYIYLSSGLPGGSTWIQQAGTAGILGSSLLGIVSGWITALVWWLVIRQNSRKRLTNQGSNQRD